MKYIRTAKGIYTDDNLHTIVKQEKPFRFDDGDYSKIGDKFIIVDNHYFYKVLKQADTIEELCDEFVFEETYPSGLKRHIITEDVAVGTQFGAIWTDKGLIYVAKMNEEGELELL